MRVELRITIDLNKDKHPNQNIIACCYFIKGKKLCGEFLKSMFAALTNMFSQN
jgi:hypothetical protein